VARTKSLPLKEKECRERRRICFGVLAIPFGAGTSRFPQQSSGLAELQRLSHNGLLVMAKAATEGNGGGHEHGGSDNALQTLHGLLSFG
jgi:hypothetical protein